MGGGVKNNKKKELAMKITQEKKNENEKINKKGPEVENEKKIH